MKTISLSRGMVTQVDDADFDWLNQWKWNAQRSKRTWHAERKDSSSGKERTVLMHRLILNARAGMQVDHRDGDGLNNQRFNLREATQTQNARNQTRKMVGATSKYKGVHWHKNHNRWSACIAIGPDWIASRRGLKQVTLGDFSTEEAAARAYDAAAKEHFGEFAHLNFPERKTE